MMQTPSIRAQAIRCQYGLSATIDIALAPGLTALIGPNGAGKSTLLRALAGFLPPEELLAGQISWFGQPIKSMRLQERAKHLAWLGQLGPGTEALHTSLLNVRGLVAGPHNASNLEQALVHYQLHSLAPRALDQLSGGELQRAQLARVMNEDKALNLLDEPSNHLDPFYVQRFEDWLRRPKATGKTICFTTHDLNLALSAFRLIMLKDGKLFGDFQLDHHSQDARSQANLQLALSDLFDQSLQLVLTPRGLRVFR